MPPSLNFYDIKEASRWNLNLNEINFTKLLTKRLSLLPKANLSDYLSILKFLYVKQNKTVFDLVGKSNIFKTLWDPLTLAVMNTPSKDASAKVLSNVLKKTIFRGKKYCNIYQPKVNWNDTIIKPCIRYLKKSGCKVKLKSILKKIDIDGKYVSKLYFNNHKININNNDLVVFAIPPSNFLKFFPNCVIPTNYNSIINVHFKLSKILKKNLSHKIIGFINSQTHWVFVKKNYLSVTISNANHLNNLDSNEIANIVWIEICTYLNIKHKITDFQVVKERKATIHQSPKNFELISKLRGIPKNLKISGDWTQTSLPCTIEGSILSGKKAVQ